MQSSFKSKLSEDDIQTIIRSAFGCSASRIAELSDGWANTAYAVTKDDGVQVIVKVASSPSTKLMRCEQHMMQTEVSVLKRLADIPGLPIPAVYAHDRSLSLVNAEYFIMEFMPGSAYNKVKDSLSESEREAVEYELGRCARLIHECSGSQFGYYSQEAKQSSSWKEAFYRIISDVLEDGRDANVRLPLSYDEIYAMIQDNMDALDEVTTPSLIHWDLWEGNVFVQDGRFVGIIDFERAMWADPLMEHYFCHFCVSYEFYKGYGRSVQTSSERRRRALYDLYLDLLLWIECTYRQYEDQNHWKWAYDNLEKGIERFRLNV